MDNQQTQARTRTPSTDTNRDNGGYKGVARQAVQKEKDYQVDTQGPTISTTVVGDNVTFTQNFNF